MNRDKNLFSRDEMLRMNIECLNRRGVELKDIAEVAFYQQGKWNPDISYQDCYDSVEKILSLNGHGQDTSSFSTRLLLMTIISFCHIIPVVIQRTELTRSF